MEKKYKIITCEKCFNIPKIIFQTINKVIIECPKCKISKIENISYFDKYKSSKDESFPELPNCTFNEDHEIKSVKY